LATHFATRRGNGFRCRPGVEWRPVDDTIRNAKEQFRDTGTPRAQDKVRAAVEVLHTGRPVRGRSELPDEAVEFVGRQVGVDPTELGFYEWSTIAYHR
jgi:hypothetical protein